MLILNEWIIFKCIYEIPVYNLNILLFSSIPLLQMILGYFCMNAHAIITYDDYKENSPWLSLAVSGLWLGNTALGCYAPHETEAYSRSKYEKDSDKDSDSDSD